MQLREAFDNIEQGLDSAQPAAKISAGFKPTCMLW